MKDPYKARGREAHAGRSARVGTAWDSEITPVYVGHDGCEYTALQMFRRFGNSKLAKSEPVKTIFIRRKHCGQHLEMDARGYAFCPICARIFNDGQDLDELESEVRPGMVGPSGSVFPCSAGRVANAAKIA